MAALFCISGQLKANNAQLMEDAVQALQNLAQQCSDPTAVQDIVTHLFKILGGEVNNGLLNQISVVIMELVNRNIILVYDEYHNVRCLWLQALRESSQLSPKR